MARHRRSESDVLEATTRYDLLVHALRRHRPGDRSGLCMVCGVGWPCVEVWLPFDPQR